MKRQLTILLASALLLLPLLGSSAHAETGTVGINAGISYGFDVEEIGLRGGATYFLNDDMRVGADLTYWLTDSPAGGSTTLMEINGNFHYLFFNEGAITAYGIGSVGIHYSKFEFDFMGTSVSDSDTDIGIGVGAGAEYDLGFMSLFAEPKLFLSGFDQLKLNLGARFFF